VKKSRRKRIHSYLGVAMFTFLLLTITYAQYSNYLYKRAESLRDRRLDLYEETTIWALNDIRTYLEVHNNSSLQNAENTMHITSSLKQQLFNWSVYNATAYPSYSKVYFLDAQYSLEKSNSFIVYLLADVTKGGQTKQLNLLCFISNNTIYNIVGY
jgi:hypothetical protein